jgi:hypothetical protein
MDINIENRLAKLEVEVSQLKKLALLTQEIEKAKSSKAVAQPRKLSFAVKSLLFVLAVGVLLLLVMPLITTAISTKFDAIATGLKIEP